MKCQKFESSGARFEGVGEWEKSAGDAQKRFLRTVGQLLHVDAPLLYFCFRRVEEITFKDNPFSLTPPF